MSIPPQQTEHTAAQRLPQPWLQRFEADACTTHPGHVAEAFLT